MCPLHLGANQLLVADLSDHDALGTVHSYTRLPSSTRALPRLDRTLAGKGSRLPYYSPESDRIGSYIRVALNMTKEKKEEWMDGVGSVKVQPRCGHDT